MKFITCMGCSTERRLVEYMRPSFFFCQARFVHYVSAKLTTCRLKVDDLCADAHVAGDVFIPSLLLFSSFK